MQLLHSVIYAAHARGTHHKLALDALTHLRVGEAARWHRLFLKHSKPYLDGSKAPDTEFKDFKNHVLHVGDDYWGGAPEKVQSWYHLLVRALQEGHWSEAAWCAGIMSHYYSDPLHPFHTAQSDAENAIHRAVEWSISKSYDALKAEAAYNAGTEVEPRSGEGWIKAFVIAGAERANAHYEDLIAHYDFQRGVVDPPEGLDPLARRIIAGLINHATLGIARLIDRAIVESGASPPDVSLTFDTIVATLQVPIKLVLKRMSDAAERRQVEAMYDELMATGRVDKTLTGDDRMVRDLYAREVLAGREAVRPDRRVNRAQAPARAQGQLFAFSPDAVATERAPLPQRAPAPVDPVAMLAPRASVPSVPRAAGGPSSVTEGLTSLPSQGADERTDRLYLAPDQDIEAAPSIGPRMAERLAAIGLRTVGDLLSADAGTVARGLADHRIAETIVRDWQQQALLVCEVPGLRGSHAQLLVGSGFRTTAEIADADPADLQAAVLRFAASSDGQRVLRDGRPPDIERIRDWIASAAAARARVA